MNQTLKEVIYEKGSRSQIKLMEELGGMNSTECRLFELYHAGETDVYAQLELGVSQTALNKIERQMRRKLESAILSCIDYTMLNRKTE